MEQRIIYVGLEHNRDGACRGGQAGGAARAGKDREHAGSVEESGGEAGESWLAPSILL